MININNKEADFKYIRELNQYKYLGIYENSRGQVTTKAKQEIVKSILYKTEKILDTKLNRNNQIKARNQSVISSITFYISLNEYEPKEFEKLEKNIRNLMYIINYQLPKDYI